MSGTSDSAIDVISKRKQRLAKTTPTFHVPNYETGRLKSFPPRSAPKPRVIRFSIQDRCAHLESGCCQLCLTGNLPAETTTSVRHTADQLSLYDIGLPGVSLEEHGVSSGTLPLDTLFWWPSLSNSRCSETSLWRGPQVSQGLFQAVIDDPVSLQALSAIVQACNLVATPGSSHAENQRIILKLKDRLYVLLRRQIESEASALRQTIMTIFFVLTLDVFDEFQPLTTTWDVHLRAILRLVGQSSNNGPLNFRLHFKNRVDIHIEYLNWMREQEKANVGDGIAEMRDVEHFPHPYPVWLLHRINALPEGFAALALAEHLSLNTVDLVEKASLLDKSFTSAIASKKGQDYGKLTSLAKEVIFRCNDQLVRRHSNHVDKIVVLSVSSFCRFIAVEMVMKLHMRPVGLGISILLFRLSCTHLARYQELGEGLHLETLAVRNAMYWAGAMLAATSFEDDPAWTLGQRLVRLCEGSESGNNSMTTEGVKEGFIWPDTLY